MIEEECEQYSDDWYRHRIGKPTASQFHNIITPTGVPTTGDKRIKYMFRLIAEKLLQQSMDDITKSQTYWMKRGRFLEEEAADKFFAQTNWAQYWTMRKVGYCTTNDKKVGCSPDRFLLRGGKVLEGIEIKCPSPWVQVEYILRGPETNYTPQVQGQMLVTGCKRWHFVSYHPNMPLVHKPIARHEDFIKKLAKELFYFCNELEVEFEKAKQAGPYKLAELLRLSAEMGDDAASFAHVQ